MSKDKVDIHTSIASCIAEAVQRAVLYNNNGISLSSSWKGDATRQIADALRELTTTPSESGKDAGDIRSNIFYMVRALYDDMIASRAALGERREETPAKPQPVPVGEPSDEDRELAKRIVDLVSSSKHNNFGDDRAEIAGMLAYHSAALRAEIATLKRQIASKDDQIRNLEGKLAPVPAARYAESLMDLALP